MTEAPPRQPAAPPQELRRSNEGRFLMGVCAGLGRHTGIDPVVFRVGFAVLLLGSGIGLFLYLAAFLLMKEPNGRPGLIEQWTRRDFDAETVMALLTAVLAFGLGINLVTVWLDEGSLVVAVFLAVSLLAAHSKGVDLLGLARSMPERLLRRRGDAPVASFEASPFQTPAPPFSPATTPVPGSRASSGAAPGVDEAVMPVSTSQAPADQEAPARQEAAHEETVAHAVQAAPAERTRAVQETPAEETAAAVKEPQEPATPVGEPGPRTSEPREAEPRIEWPREAEPRIEGPRQADPRIEKPQEPDPLVRGLREVAEGVRNAAYQARQATHGERVSPDAVTAQHAVPPYEQRSSYRSDPPTAVNYSSYGEPFAPNGPYQPLDPAKRAGGYSPYDPVYYGRPVPPKQPKPRPRSYIGAITILLAIIIGGIVVAVQAGSDAGVSPTIVGGAMLITIGAGLLVAAWWGRGAGLVAAGTAVAVIVSIGLMLGGLPRNIGPSEWTPTSLADAGRLYDVGVGDGRLDLSELELPPGTNVTFNAAISAGELEVIVPPTARVEVHATNKIGDIVIDQSLRGGVNIRSDKVLEPDVEPKGAVSTIVLYLRGGVGDMEVRRAA